MSHKSALTQSHCEACRADAPKVTATEQEVLMQQLLQWQVVQIDHVDQLLREFSFSNFVEALAFTNQVGELAEAEGHHPAILTEWGKVQIRWWSHKIKGLHRNDFICAAKTDAIFEQYIKTN